MTAKVYIDGQAGTTGLQIRERLAGRADLDLILLDEADRKRIDKRQEVINDVDVVILCLPDAAAREAVTLVKSNNVRVIDASTAHRVDPDWVYGLPEYAPDWPDRLRAARFISNPGCYPTGPILMLAPLVRTGILPAEASVSITGISGYTGGGKALIERYEQADHAAAIASAFRAYSLKLQHKHVPELQKYSLLAERPIFLPSVAHLPQGMMTIVPLHMRDLNGSPSAAGLQHLLAETYTDAELVQVMPYDRSAELEAVEIEALAGTDRLEMHVLGDQDQAVLVAVYDNLGKGASGAAVQNMDLIIGARG